MPDLDRQPGAVQFPVELEQAAGAGSQDQVRGQFPDLFDQAPGDAGGEPGVSQVESASQSATARPTWQFQQFQAGEGAEKLPGGQAELRLETEVAGIVIQDPEVSGAVAPRLLFWGGLLVVEEY